MKLEHRETILFNSPDFAPRMLVPPLIKTFTNFEKIIHNNNTKFSSSGDYLCFCTFYKIWSNNQFRAFKHRIHYPEMQLNLLQPNELQFHSKISPLMKNISKCALLHLKHWENEKYKVLDSQILKIHYSYSITTFKFLINRIDDACTKAEISGLPNWKTSSLISLEQKCMPMHLSTFHVKVVLINPNRELLFLSKIKSVVIPEKYTLPSKPKVNESSTFELAKITLQSLSIFEHDVEFLSSWVTTTKKDENTLSPFSEYFLVYLQTQLPVRIQDDFKTFRFISQNSLQKLFSDCQELQEYLHALRMFQKLM